MCLCVRCFFVFLWRDLKRTGQVDFEFSMYIRCVLNERQQRIEKRMKQT